LEASRKPVVVGILKRADIGQNAIDEGVKDALEVPTHGGSEISLQFHCGLIRRQSKWRALSHRWEAA
jgi:hypothetical protein